MDEYNCTKVKVRDKNGYEFYALFDKSRQLLFPFDYITIEFAIQARGIEFIEESEDEE